MSPFASLSTSSFSLFASLAGLTASAENGDGADSGAFGQILGSYDFERPDGPADSMLAMPMTEAGENIFDLPAWMPVASLASEEDAGIYPSATPRPETVGNLPEVLATPFPESIPPVTLNTTQLDQLGPAAAVEAPTMDVPVMMAAAAPLHALLEPEMGPVNSAVSDESAELPAFVEEEAKATTHSSAEGPSTEREQSDSGILAPLKPVHSASDSELDGPLHLVKTASAATAAQAVRLPLGSDSTHDGAIPLPLGHGDSELLVEEGAQDLLPPKPNTETAAMTPLAETSAATGTVESDSLRNVEAARNYSQTDRSFEKPLPTQPLFERLRALAPESAPTESAASPLIQEAELSSAGAEPAEESAPDHSGPDALRLTGDDSPDDANEENSHPESDLPPTDIADLEAVVDGDETLHARARELDGLRQRRAQSGASGEPAPSQQRASLHSVGETSISMSPDRIAPAAPRPVPLAPTVLGGGLGEELLKEVADAAIRSGKDALLDSVRPAHASFQLEVGDLGSLHARLNLAAGDKLTVVLQAQDARLANALEADADALMEALEAQQFQVEDIEISQGVREDSRAVDWSSTRDEQKERETEERSRTKADQKDQDQEEAPRRRRRSAHDGELDTEA